MTGYMPAFLEIYAGFLIVIGWSAWLGRGGAAAWVRWTPLVTGVAVATGQLVAFVALVNPAADHMVPVAVSGARWLAAGGVALGLSSCLVASAIAHSRHPTPPADRPADG